PVRAAAVGLRDAGAEWVKHQRPDHQRQEDRRDQRARQDPIPPVPSRTHTRVIPARSAPMLATASPRDGTVTRRRRRARLYAWGGERSRRGTQWDSPPVRDWTSAAPRAIDQTTTRPSF